MYIHSGNKETANLGTPLTSLNDLSGMNGMYFIIVMHNAYNILYTCIHTHRHTHRQTHTHTYTHKLTVLLEYVNKLYVLLEHIYLFPVSGANEDIFSLAEALQPNTTGKKLRNIFCLSFYQQFIILVILL